MMQNIFSATAKTLKGFENVLETELNENGIAQTTQVSRGVQFKCNLEDIYRLNYSLSTALKILIQIKEFEIVNEHTIYDEAKKIEWSEIFPSHRSFSVDKTIYSDLIKNSHYASLLVKDAVADYFREKFKLRPNVDKDNPDVRISLHVNGNKANISIDTSGDPLFKRAYREGTNQAPMNEVLAAGLVRLAGIKAEDGLIFDPMCGSGTILIETAYRIYNFPAAYRRREFGFMKLKNYEALLWQEVRKKRNKKIIHKSAVKIKGADKDAGVLDFARENITRSGLEMHVNIKRADFFETKPPADTGVIITNPPFDIRLKEDDIEAFYAQIGDTLKYKYPNWTANIFSANIQALEHLNLVPEFVAKLKSGKLDAEMRQVKIHPDK